MAKKTVTPEEAGRNLEEFALWNGLAEEAELLGTKTRREVEASTQLSPEEWALARELGRKAKEAFAKAEAEQQALAKRQASAVAKPASNVVRLDEQRRHSRRRSST
jgi:hypothetical protein